MTFYLKYRPQKVSELDLATVRKELGVVLSSGKFSHAYLFVGPRGTGKTSAARILAKVVNCKRNTQFKNQKKKRSLLEPCNVCTSCKEITLGNALDLIEIDAASNRGIDDIRELRERIKLAPTNSLFKAYIIDEVHMLTNEAFNALLKTLEEPPAHSLFILCTTEPSKVPETIVSRCTKILFKKASVDEVIRSLKKVTKGEKLTYEDGVLEAIAESVDGSFRDAVKLLEQLSLRRNMKRKGKFSIRLSDVKEVVGLAGEAASRKFLKALAVNDKDYALGAISLMSKEGVSLKEFIREMLELLRKLLLTEVGVLDEERVEGLDLASIRLLIKVFSEAAYSMRTAVIEELPLEMAVVEWIGGRGTYEEPKAESKITDTHEASTKDDSGQDLSSVSISQIIENWPVVLEKLRPENHSVEALLKATKPVDLADGTIIVEVYYKFHKEQLELSRYKKMVESAVSNVISDGLQLKYVLKERGSERKSAQKKNENISGKVEDEEIVRAAEEIFGG
jgi:DNA polymerase-3 subunit gamma/tau